MEETQDDANDDEFQLSGDVSDVGPSVNDAEGEEPNVAVSISLICCLSMSWMCKEL